jgi:hypothetical protein
MTLTTNTVRIENSNIPSVSVDMSPVAITDALSGNSITFDRLCYLPIGLAALTEPLNPTTCNFNDAIQIQDYDTTLSPPLTHTELKISANPATSYGIDFQSTTTTPFLINGNTPLDIISSNYITMTASNEYITITSDDDLTLTSANQGNINLNAPNINSYGWALPICLNFFDQNSYNYGAGGQILQDVYQVGFTVPNQFFSDVPQSGYTATRWQINYDLNQFNMSDNGDKGFAMYFELWDSNSNVYSPFLYNQLTPFCRWNNSAGFSNGTYSNFSSVNWCDYVDLGGLAGTFDGNLTLHLYVAGNNPFSSEFKLKLGFTRINRI